MCVCIYVYVVVQQPTATHCNIRNTVQHCNVLQNTATDCESWNSCGAACLQRQRLCSKSLQHTTICCKSWNLCLQRERKIVLQHTATATHCSTLQHNAIHCNTLQPHCNTLQPATRAGKHAALVFTEGEKIVQQLTATQCNSLQHPAK